MANFLDFLNSRWDNVIQGTIEHAIYIVSVIVVATIIGVGTGILVRNRPVAREVVLGIYAVFLTIPSFGLFALFIPIVGLGFWGPFIALTMYALLPIARNTVTGLAGVSPAVIESARGMGLSNNERLLKIQLPLAWPVILTGIRVSSLIVAGIAAIATLVAGGGLGDFIKSGLSRLGAPNSTESILVGTIFIIILALVIDAVFIAVKRATTSPGIR
ncbi:MAG TPA: ABC transporter permease [Acidimicrobiia bacterium]|nr:ABC transporter permease [Acidimicrobiia bacterium]